MEFSCCLLLCYGLLKVYLYLNIVVLRISKKFPYFGNCFFILHLKNENVEFVPIVIEPHWI